MRGFWLSSQSPILPSQSADVGQVMPDQAKLTTLDQLEAELERLRSDAIGAGLWVLVPPIEETLKTLRKERLRLKGGN